MSIYRKCCVSSCPSNTSGQGAGLLHKFPQNVDRRRLWLWALSFVTNLERDPHFLLICEKHFEKRFMGFKQCRLRCEAYPTLFTPEEISKGFPENTRKVKEKNFYKLDHDYIRTVHKDHTYSRDECVTTQNAATVPNPKSSDTAADPLDTQTASLDTGLDTLDTLTAYLDTPANENTVREIATENMDSDEAGSGNDERQTERVDYTRELFSWQKRGIIAEGKHSVPIHQFPHPQKRPEMFAAWVSAAGDNLQESDHMKIFKSKRICDHHFDSSLKVYGRRLLWSAIPTVHLNRVHQSNATFVKFDHSYCHPKRDLPVPSADSTTFPLPSGSESNELGNPLEEDEVVEVPDMDPDLTEVSMYHDDEPAFAKNDPVPSTETGYICNVCETHIIGFRYTCVQCADWDLCGACEARTAHATHYVLRVPSPRPYKEIQAVLAAIRHQLLSENLFLQEITDGTKVEVKDEPVEGAACEPAAEADPLASLTGDLGDVSNSDSEDSDSSDQSVEYIENGDVPPPRKRPRSVSPASTEPDLSYSPIHEETISTCDSATIIPADENQTIAPDNQTTADNKTRTIVLDDLTQTLVPDINQTRTIATDNQTRTLAPRSSTNQTRIIASNNLQRIVAPDNQTRTIVLDNLTQTLVPDINQTRTIATDNQTRTLAPRSYTNQTRIIASNNLQRIVASDNQTKTTVLDNLTQTLAPDINQTRTNAANSIKRIVVLDSQTITKAPINQTTVNFNQTRIIPCNNLRRIVASDSQTRTLAPVNQTAANFNQTRIIASNNLTTIVAPDSQTRTLAPVNQTRTLAPVNQTRMVVPINQTRTNAPVNQTRMVAPDNQTRTNAPINQTRMVIPRMVAPGIQTKIGTPDNQTIILDDDDNLSKSQDPPQVIGINKITGEFIYKSRKCYPNVQPVTKRADCSLPPKRSGTDFICYAGVARTNQQTLDVRLDDPPLPSKTGEQNIGDVQNADAENSESSYQSVEYFASDFDDPASIEPNLSHSPTHETISTCDSATIIPANENQTRTIASENQTRTIASDNQTRTNFNQKRKTRANLKRTTSLAPVNQTSFDVKQSRTINSDNLTTRPLAPNNQTGTIASDNLTTRTLAPNNQTRMVSPVNQTITIDDDPSESQDAPKVITINNITEAIYHPPKSHPVGARRSHRAIPRFGIDFVRTEQLTLDVRLDDPPLPSKTGEKNKLPLVTVEEQKKTLLRLPEGTDPAHIKRALTEVSVRIERLEPVEKSKRNTSRRRMTRLK